MLVISKNYLNNYMKKETPNNEIIIYQTESNEIKIDVRLEGDTVWLTQAQLVDLYQSSKANISEHIKNHGCPVIS